MALSLGERGHTVRLISQKIPSFAESYDLYVKAHSIHQMREAIKVLAPVTDVFHCHNEPSWFVTLVKEMCDVPVVLDVHDSYLARVTPDEADRYEEDGKDYLRVTVEERNNFQLADGLVFPSPTFAGMICQEYNLTQPSLVLPSYVNRNLYAYNCQEWMGGLVYEGRVDLAEDLKESKQKTGFSYTVYEPLAKKAKEIGLDFHLYSRSDDKFKEAYKDALVHDPVPYPKLMRAISRHDWGLVGNLHKTPEWKVAFPNKLFEYLAAGVPVVAINADYCGGFLEREGLGIAVDSLEELCNRWGEHTEIRKTVLKRRLNFCMENHIDRLESLYQEVTRGA
jgi:glycosyltransferase involved in cell wall biosynthesis